MSKKNILKIISAVLLLASCSAKKTLVNDSKPTVATQKPTAQNDEFKELTFVQKVSDNSVYLDNITSKLDFTINTGSKEISVGGSLRMKKNDVIRLQLMLPIIGTEVGRLEFTKDYVMIVDRINREYIKADYNQVSFLKDNGLNFYSLQALLWNKLFIPGNDKITIEQLKNFKAELGAIGTDIPIMLDKGNMKFKWLADKLSGRIKTADIEYKSNAHGSSRLLWMYDNFKPLGSKHFPNKQTITFSTTALKGKKRVMVTLDMNGVNTNSGWETRTTVSDKYRKVSAEEVLNKIMNM